MILKDQRAIAIAVQKKIGNLMCIHCQTPNAYEFTEEQSQELCLTIQDGGIQYADKTLVIPCLLGVCKHCGHITKFSLKKLLDDSSK